MDIFADGGISGNDFCSCGNSIMASGSHRFTESESGSGAVSGITDG